METGDTALVQEIRKVWTIAWPLILTNMLNVAVGIVDFKMVGVLGYESIARADLPMVQAIVLIVSMFYVVLTFLSDLLNAFLDPRIKLEGG